MINLEFLHLSVEGFQSIGTASLDFNNLGTCFIKGINKYDSKTKSNGSGKSSLLLSLYWCLFGKTPAGISSNVVNKFVNSGCNVELCLKVDGITYDIKRSQNHHKYKTNLTILKDSEDISGRNKSDSEKIIKEILKIDEEVFSQMIFLSQGFSSRFALYSPKARKELLESLYHIDERLECFVNNLKIKEATIKHDIEGFKTNELELSTKNQMLENSIANITNHIYETNDKIVELLSTKSNITKEDIKNLQAEYDTKCAQVEKLSEKHNQQKINCYEIDRSISELRNKKSKYENEILGFSNNKICPTCGTLLEDYTKNEHIQRHISELSVEIETISEKIELLISQYNSNNEILNQMNLKLSMLNTSKNNIKNELSLKNAEYQNELQKDTQIKTYEEKIAENQQQISEMCKFISDNNAKLVDIQSKIIEKEKTLEILQHSIRLANNQFKAYLLENVINLLNVKLKELSTSIFENEMIQISGDNKLDIYIGDKTYEQCSGGEQRKIDIAIIIAQRFLAQQMHSISSNILILDEVFDGCDDVSFGIILDLLSDEIQNVERTFTVSHRDIKEIPFDKIITVVKDTNQISHLE